MGVTTLHHPSQSPAQGFGLAFLLSWPVVISFAISVGRSWCPLPYDTKCWYFSTPCLSSHWSQLVRGSPQASTHWEETWEEERENPTVSEWLEPSPARPRWPIPPLTLRKSCPVGLLHAHSVFSYLLHFLLFLSRITHLLHMLTHSQTAEPLNCYLHSCCCVLPLCLSSHTHLHIPARLQEWETAELKVTDSQSVLSPSPQTQLF